MKKINFSQHVLPHVVAVAIFLLVTLLFFKPVFFENKALEQYDILQWEGSAKTLRDYREETGEEGLWASSMFSGMPAYLVNVEWGNGIVVVVKKVLGFGLAHPYANIFIAFLSYYIMLLTFGVRPWLAIAGAVAFGLSSYVIIGLTAGHNARVGAIAFMPLMMAGVHVSFCGKRILGFGVTAAALALHLRENHVQITYYFAIIVLAYAIVQLILFIRANQTGEFFKTAGILIPAAILAVGTFIGPLWAVTEYSSYSIRGKSELTAPASEDSESSGLSKTYAFEFSNGVAEPLTLLVPNIYGGSTGNFLFLDQTSETYQALVSSGDQRMANQLVNYTSAYWGPQRMAAPYYAGAIIVFLFGVGIAFAEKKYVQWLLPVSILAVMMSWGSTLGWFNYFLFDYLPAYNKFRSPTFALIIILFAMPLLGMLGLEKLMKEGLSPAKKKKLLMVLASTGGLCLLLMMFAGMFSFVKAGEEQLPAWFLNALTDDRKSLLRSDAFRSLAFIVSAFVVMYFEVYRKFTPIAFYIFLISMITIDLAVVDKRYLTNDNFKRKREANLLAITEADQEILKDKSYYRVYNLQSPFTEARTSYYHNSLGGYHGAKLRRYQDLYDSCLFRETNQLIRDLQSDSYTPENYGMLNMLNTKYIVFGAQRNNVIQNPAALGSAWFVKDVELANSPTEELQKVCTIDTRETAVVDKSKFTVNTNGYDSSATIRLIEHTPKHLKYESNSSADGLAVFSEIYYEKGWRAFIDGQEKKIVRANYVLRALEIPQGKHTIEFKFEPKAYTVGNTITMASSWLMFLILLTSIGWSVKQDLRN